MGLELGVVELPERVLHVLVAHVLDGAGAVLEDVGVAHVAGLAHVVLQVLPTARRRETWNGRKTVKALEGDKFVVVYGPVTRTLYCDLRAGPPRLPPPPRSPRPPRKLPPPPRGNSTRSL